MKLFPYLQISLSSSSYFLQTESSRLLQAVKYNQQVLRRPRTIVLQLFFRQISVIERSFEVSGTNHCSVRENQSTRADFGSSMLNLPGHITLRAEVNKDDSKGSKSRYSTHPSLFTLQITLQNKASNIRLYSLYRPKHPPRTPIPQPPSHTPHKS